MSYIYLVRTGLQMLMGSVTRTPLLLVKPFPSSVVIMISNVLVPTHQVKSAVSCSKYFLCIFRVVAPVLVSCRSSYMTMVVVEIAPFAPFFCPLLTMEKKRN